MDDLAEINALEVMVNRSKLLLFLLVLCSTVLPLSAGIFGIDMGMSMEDLKSLSIQCIKDVAAPDFIQVIPLKADSQFENCRIKIDYLYGVCMIELTTYRIPTNGYGREVQTLYESIESSLREQYGEPIIIDRLLCTSSWRDARYWMRSLIDGDRFYYSRWGDGTELPAHEYKELAEIVLKIEPISENVALIKVIYSSVEGEMVLNYQPKNIGACL